MNRRHHLDLTRNSLLAALFILPLLATVLAPRFIPQLAPHGALAADAKLAPVKPKIKPGIKPAVAPAAKTEGDAKFDVHHWGVWLADPAFNVVNSREHFVTGLPLSVETTRPRRLKGNKKSDSPLNVVTFRGQAPPSLEIDLKLQSGALVGHWPAGQIKNNRLRWSDYKLTSDPSADASWASAPADHWFTRAREEAGSLVLRKGSRAEKFLTYDFEAPFPLPLTLTGGPDAYELRSTATYALHDVVIVAPDAENRRIGWLDLLPAAHDPKPAAVAGSPAAPSFVPGAITSRTIVRGGATITITSSAGSEDEMPAASAPAQSISVAAPGPPVSVAMSAPLAVGGDAWTAQSKTKLAERLTKAGLAPREVDLLLSIYEPAIFASPALIVAWRLPSGIVEELEPLTVEPPPAKMLHVVLVIARNLDPKISRDLQTFVDQLGSRKYKEREAAEQQLAGYGSLAFPVLKQALTNRDPEIAFRAERLLLDQQQSIDLPPGGGR